MAGRYATVSLGLVLLLVPALARATSLGSYNVDSNGVTVAGISSGGFMAVQLDVAYSSHFHGVAVFAGGPFYCAQDSESNATGSCESGSSIPLSTLVDYTNTQASAGTIDPTSHLHGQPVYLFSGTDDTTVHQAVMNSLQQYYETYTSSSDITYDNTTAAAHGWISLDGPNSCDSSYSPYINNCSIDAEQTFLTQFYGSLSARNSGTLGGSFIQFDQDPFCSGGSCSGSSMDGTGWVFVPASCQSGTRCRLIVVLHGCLQYQGIVGEDLVKESGVDEWADTNDLIVLYPQTIASSSLGNPEGCWDWWGYGSADYALQSGPQMQAIMAMVHQLSAGLPAGGNPVTDGGSPVADGGLPSDGGSSGACTSVGFACTGATCCTGYSCQSGICLPGGSGACTGLGEACASSDQCCAGASCQSSLCLPGGSTVDAGSDVDGGPT